MRIDRKLCITLYFVISYETVIRMMKMNLKMCLMVCATTMILACKSTKEMNDYTKEDLRFSLSKGVCFGSCPVYTLNIFHGGYAVFTGKMHTDKLGQYDKKLSKEEFKRLEKAFDNEEFAEFPDDFNSQIADLPLITIGYHNGKTFRTIKGKEDRPEALMQAQFELEKIVDSDGWNLVKGLEELRKELKPEPTYIYEEVIIEPKRGLLLSKWIEENKDYGVRLIKKIAPNLNYFLIGYDSQKISSKDFLKMLQKDKDIISAEFNKNTTLRGN